MAPTLKPIKLRFLLLLAIFTTSSALHHTEASDFKISSAVAKITHEWSRSRKETIVACFINFKSPVFETILEQLLRESHRSGYNVVLSTDPFRSSIRPSDFRCSLTVMAIDLGEEDLRFIDLEGRLQRWNRFGLFVAIHSMFVSEREMVLINWIFGLGKVFFVRCGLQDGNVRIRYSLAYYNKAITVEQSAIGFWVNFDQQKDFNGYLYEVMASYNVPYLYKRSSTVTSGIDFRFLTSMASHQNASYAIHYSAEDRTGKFLEDKITLLFMKRSYTLTRGDLIYLNEQDTQCVLLAKQRIKNYFIHLLKPFLTAVWIVIVCLGVLLVTIQKVWPHFFTHNYVLAVFFGIAIEEHRLPPVDRTIIFNIGLVVFLLSEAYLAVMTTFMFNMKYEPELKSFEELAAKNIPLYVPPDHYILLKKTSHSTKLSIMLFDQETPNEDDEASVKRLYDPSRAYLVPCSHARWTVGRPYMRNQYDYQYYVIQESIYFRLQTFSAIPTCLSSEKISDYVRRFAEAGFWQHWESIETEYLHWHEGLETSEMLSFQALISLFWILIFGNGLAIVCFVIEIGLNYAKIVGNEPV